MANSGNADILQPHLDVLKDPKATPEQVNAALQAIVSGTSAGVTGKLGEDIKLVQRVVGARNSTLETVAEENRRNRTVQELELLFRDPAQDEAEEGTNPAMNNRLKTFDTVRQEQRFNANAALREMGTLIIELQKTLVDTFEKDEEGAKEGYKTKLQQLKIIGNIVKVVKKLGCTVEKDDVEKYLLHGDTQALANITDAVKGADKGTEIVNNLVEGRANFERFKVYGDVRISGLGKVMMKAALGTNIEVSDYKKLWFTELLSKPQYRGGMVDLNLDDGSGFLLYVPKDPKGAVEILYANTPPYRDSDDKIQLLKQLENPADPSRPTASLVYAHVYEEDEILDAFSKLPDGAEVQARVLTDSAKCLSATLVKTAGKLEYAKAPAGAPSIDELRKRPCRWMDAATINFVLSERVRTKILEN